MLKFIHVETKVLHSAYKLMSLLLHKNILSSGLKVREYIHHFTPSAPIQEWVWDEISEARAHNNCKEDPGVVRHDTEHQHVAQSDLQKVEERLNDVKHPAEKQRRLLLKINVTYTQIWMCILTHRWVSESSWPVPDVHSRAWFPGCQGDFRLVALQYCGTVTSDMWTRGIFQVWLWLLWLGFKPHPPHFKQLVENSH